MPRSPDVAASRSRYWLCAQRGDSLSPTRSAPQLRLAPSTISTSVRRLIDAGLVDDDGTGVFPELFWELADAWAAERTWLIASPDPANHTDPDPHAPRWRRTGTAAAAAYGAPVVSTAGGPIELYVKGPVEVSVAVRRYGRAAPGTGAAVVAVAPVSEVVAGVGDNQVPLLDGWPAAPVLAVALDLAQDRARVVRFSATGASTMPSGGDLVVLPGDAMVPLVRAVAALGEAGVGRYAVVGGVAVAVRLGQAHRATADVDTVVDETSPPDAVEALLALPDTVRDASADHQVLVAGTKVEILGIRPLAEPDLEGIPTKDALFVASHVWALDSASPITVVAAAAADVRASAPFATPAALIAMKLHAIEDRSNTTGQHKRAGDAWDIYRILVDLDIDGSVRTAFRAASGTLRDLVRDAAERVLVTAAARTTGWLRAGNDEMAAVTAEELRLVGRALIGALD